MIIPSIDIQNGRAVQLRQGREFVLDGGDPIQLLERFSVVGEVAVIDLDAALGEGDNRELIREMVRLAPCRVGGGIRDLESAHDWLDRGARRIILGTAAKTELCSQLPAERLIAAVDCRGGRVVVDGWREPTERSPLEAIDTLRPYVGGFLLTQVEREGEMEGFDEQLLREAKLVAEGRKLTAAGGITTSEEISTLDAIGIDAQIGMAIYTGRLSVGEAVAASLQNGIQREGDPIPLWPTVVTTVNGTALGLVWSSRETVAQAIEECRGVYWSRSRSSTWIKGATSGATQSLVRVDLDCDRDALRFTVEQSEPGFCHRETPGCWPLPFAIGTLETTLARRQIESLAETASTPSGTAALFRDPSLLASKLREEAEELLASASKEEAEREFADLLYFGLTAMRARGGELNGALRELEVRRGRVTRRPMQARAER